MCAVTNLTADEIMVTGGTVAEIIPVPDTFDYFVWIKVNFGAASLAIALMPGEVPNLAHLNVLTFDCIFV